MKRLLELQEKLGKEGLSIVEMRERDHLLETYTDGLLRIARAAAEVYNNMELNWDGTWIINHKTQQLLSLSLSPLMDTRPGVEFTAEDWEQGISKKYFMQGHKEK